MDILRHEAFIKNVRKTDTCWIWIGCKDFGGYGRFTFKKKEMKAHRASYELFKEPIPYGLLIRHNCDNPSCVNPAHLHIGTNSDNMIDREQRGRANHSTKLTADEVREIKILLGFGFTNMYLARQYKVSGVLVGLIANGQVWKHVTMSQPVDTLRVENIKIDTSKMDDKERFLSNVTKTETCWIWNTCKTPRDYGKFVIDGICYKAHRIAYILFKGSISDDLLIRHKCDNPNCVNPYHLETGTKADNNRDTLERGRGNRVKGEKHPGAKLKEDDVLEIRILFGFGFTCNELAKRFNVGSSAISSIKSGRKWKYLT